MIGIFESKRIDLVLSLYKFRRIGNPYREE